MAQELVKTEAESAGEDRGMLDVAQSRVAQEIQSAMIVAKKCPRDENAAFARMMVACKRKSLAEQAVYAYPRGGSVVTGPSIRLAEALAMSWGNLDFGIVEIEQRRGDSTVMAYAWDLETNVRQTKIFTVPHSRYTKRQGLVSLADPRDIYEMTANQGARRLRACILGVIPGDIVEAAVDQCQKTLSSGETEPLKDRVRQMASAFQSNFGVSVSMIETRLGHRLDVTTEPELVTLRGIFRAIRDNMQSPSAFFETGEGIKSAKERLQEAAKAAAEEPPEEEVTVPTGAAADALVEELTEEAVKPKKASKGERLRQAGIQRARKLGMLDAEGEGEAIAKLCAGLTAAVEKDENGEPMLETVPDEWVDQTLQDIAKWGDD